MNYPSVIGEFDTLAAVLAGKSIARYGDGELKLMHGQAYVRVSASIEITTELLQILQSPNENCIVGIPTMAPEGPKCQNWLRHAERFAKVLRPDDVQYYSAFITRPDSAPWINTMKFANRVQRLWRKKRATVLCEPENKILKAVRLSTTKVRQVICPSREAYSEIDRLEQEIIATSPDIVLLSCGPTATCLANRLASRGIHAVDIGSAGGFLLKLLIV